MKKIITILCIIVVLTGCSFGSSEAYNAKVRRYESLIQAILDNSKFKTKSENFNMVATMNQEKTGYSYDLKIDKARVAMYQIEVIVVENNQQFNKDKMMVSSGIFEDSRTMVPGQVNLSQNYVGGMILNALSDNPEMNLKVMVTWKDQSLANTHSEFIELNVKYQAPQAPQPENQEESAPANP